jgi:nucleotide-binding universal stress UspA family protein
MTSSILCAIDISTVGADTHVLTEAITQAKMHNAFLDVVTVLPDFGFSMVGTFFDKDQHKEAEEATKQKLDALIAPLTQAKKMPVTRTVVATGSVYEQVLKMAKKTKCDLIIIGAHRPELRDYLLGPNSARIVRHSNCSVYVVRN